MTVLRTAAQQGVDAIDGLARHARAPDPAAISLFTKSEGPSGLDGADGSGHRHFHMELALRN